MKVPLAIGDRVGVIESTNQFGQGVRLGDGDWSLLFFYPFAFTPTCTGELGQLTREQGLYREAGVRLAAMSCDPVFSLRVFAETEGIEFDLLSDFWPHGEQARRFGVFADERGCAVRGSFLLDPAGVLRWSVVNPIGERRDLDTQLADVRGIVAGESAVS